MSRSLYVCLGDSAFPSFFSHFVFFLYFYTKHSRKLTLNSALILSRRSPTLARLFLSLEFFFLFLLLYSQFVNFLILNFGLPLSLLWFHGKKYFSIGLDVNSTRPYVRQASSASLTASRPFFFFFDVMQRVFISV